MAPHLREQTNLKPVLILTNLVFLTNSLSSHTGELSAYDPFPSLCLNKIIK
jgi:hypothetical protein